MNMHKLTAKERIDLGAKLAKAQTMVLRAFRLAIDDPLHPNVEIMTNDLVQIMASSDSTQRFIVVDGIEICIALMSERICSESDASKVETAKRVQRVMHNVVNRMIERTVEIDVLASAPIGRPLHKGRQGRSRLR